MNEIAIPDLYTKNTPFRLRKDACKKKKKKNSELITFSNQEIQIRELNQSSPENWS